LKDMHLALFFTEGVSLGTWDAAGMLERETALYKALLPRLGSITFVTYGKSGDLRYSEQLEGIRILCNRWNLPRKWYARLLAGIYPRFWARGTILKTNQAPGAEIPLKITRGFNNSLIARCGYLYSDFVKWNHGEESDKARQAEKLEKELFHAANKVVVTTQEIRRAVIQRYGIPGGKVSVIPNYVETDRFVPMPELRQPDRLCFVGRLHKEKNVEALLSAVAGFDGELDVIGGGPLRERLEERIEREGLRVNLLGNVRHSELPYYMNRASLFILPSNIEGHPKTLIEAMSCGLPVIGADVPGIRELIRHRETGYLCGNSPEEIRAAIHEVMSDPDMREHMGREGRKYVLRNFDLGRIVEMELNVLKELTG